MLQRLGTSLSGLSEEEASGAAGKIRLQRSGARKAAKLVATFLHRRPQPAGDFAHHPGDPVFATGDSGRAR